MIKYTESGWQLTDNDKLDILGNTERIDDINHAPDYSYVDYSAYEKYYFDSENGDDNNDGKSCDNPKKSLKEAEYIISTVKNDKKVEILFKKNSVFSGGFTIKGATPSELFPLIISSYGNGASYPVFTGTETVVKVCVSNVRIYGIEVTGPSAIRGIHVFPVKKGAMKNIVIEGCYVHDINFLWNYPKAPKDTCPDEIDIESVCPHFEPDGKTLGRYWYRYHGGIIFHNEIGPSWFENIWVLRNVVKNVARTGMTIYSKWVNKPGVGYGYNKWAGYDFSDNDVETGIGYFINKKIYWNDNYIECAGGDGLVVSSAEDVFVERNVAYYCNILGRKGYWNAAIWVYNVYKCIFQYNEAAYTWRRYGSEDCQGFDLDNACRDVIFQFNYSHHNEGGGMLVCNLATNIAEYNADGTPKATDDKGEPKVEKLTGRWFNNIIRNNVFYENGQPSDAERSAFITIARETDNMFVYNNTVILRDDIKGQSIIFTEDKSTFCFNNTFINNVFYCNKETNAIFTLDMMKNYRFINNVYHNVGKCYLDVSDENPIVNDPKICVMKDCEGFESSKFFAVKSDYVLNKGLKVSIKSKFDAFGNSGLYNYVGAIVKNVEK